MERQEKQRLTRVLEQSCKVVSLLLTLLLTFSRAQAGTELYFIHNDHLGTPQVVTDQNQTVVWQGRQKPFGEVYEETGTIDQNARFPGQYFDEESSFTYNYFRDYDPSTGRYIQSDPIGLNGGLNTYGYVYQSPLRYIDSYGLDVMADIADRAAGLTPDTPRKKKKRDCVTKCVLVGEGTSAARDKAVEEGLEATYGRSAKIIWRRLQKIAGPIGWAYSVYDCNEECDEECET